MRTRDALELGLLCIVLLSCTRHTASSTDLSPRLKEDDAEVLMQLQNAGSDLSKPHVMNFYLYLPVRESAEEIAEMLRQDGYQVTVELGADDVSWLCLASKTLIPSDDALATILNQMETLAKSKNGVFDGWEAAVTP